jgi:hypothetical protein
MDEAVSTSCCNILIIVVIFAAKELGVAGSHDLVLVD